ncbi:hypothetical protein BZG20_01545 [Salinivibrio sp. IB868]|uniref:DUF6414 family protein n=1 Tax=unclassified Salinivibrio TaxID=2636825 RepID=UPI000984207B|nr:MULTISPECIES: hypothetical protein [unclassified Salinivibrio]OOE69638.1 hypothetical protein BZG20_01545 [Salinivibrio sp. IB868]OOE73527.1 hypothetical protein BZG22_10445 [Salinivibrio sp. IB870]
MDRLIVPVYLNQKLVFDLLAMLQGGISTVTTVTESSLNKNTDGEKVSAGFGLSEAFSTLLKIDLTGSKEKTVGTEEANTSSQERVHTPASLFFQLRNTLLEKGYLKETHEELPKAGDFVEFEGFLKRNPIVETIDSLAEMMDMADVFEDKPQPKKGRRNQISENQKIKQQMLRFSDTLKAGSTIDLSSASLKAGYTAVVTVETGFLNDPLMSDLVDGQFKIIGKVIKSVSDSSDSINLLRKTALSKMPSTLMLDALGNLSSLGSEQGFDIPDLKLEIEGPAIQILPIAIYA